METINNILQEIFSNDIAIGVITGIIVAAVGVIINKKSMSGKLNVSIKDWCRLQASKIVSKGEHKNSANVEKYLLGYKFEIQPYNSSNYTKIMKNIEIEFISGKNKFVVKTEIENQKPINVLPKTCPSFNGYVHIYFVDEGLSERKKMKSLIKTNIKHILVNSIYKHF